MKMLEKKGFPGVDFPQMYISGEYQFPEALIILAENLYK